MKPFRYPLQSNEGDIFSVPNFSNTNLYIEMQIIIAVSNHIFFASRFFWRWEHQNWWHWERWSKGFWNLQHWWWRRIDLVWSGKLFGKYTFYTFWRPKLLFLQIRIGFWNSNLHKYYIPRLWFLYRIHQIVSRVL